MTEMAAEAVREAVWRKFDVFRQLLLNLQVCPRGMCWDRDGWHTDWLVAVVVRRMDLLAAAVDEVREGRSCQDTGCAEDGYQGEALPWQGLDSLDGASHLRDEVVELWD